MCVLSSLLAPSATVANICNVLTELIAIAITSQTATCGRIAHHDRRAQKHKSIVWSRFYLINLNLITGQFTGRYEWHMNGQQACHACN